MVQSVIERRFISPVVADNPFINSPVMDFSSGPPFTSELALGFVGRDVGADPNIAGIANFISAFKTAKPLIIANTASGNRNIICTGDSQVGGIGSSAPSKNWPSMLSDALTAAGIPSEHDSIMTDNNAFNFATWETRATKSGGANAVLGNFIGGASCFACITDTVSEWNFSFPTCDKFEVYIAQPGDGSGGTLNVGTDGTNFLTATGTGAGVVLKALKTPVGGALPHILNLKRSAGLSPQIVGVHAYTTTVKKFSVLNLGQSGAVIANLDTGLGGGTSKPGQKDLVASIAPTLTLVCCHYNDGLGPTDINTYKTRLTNVLTHAKTFGDVIAVLGPQIGSSYVSYAVQDSFRQAVRDVVAAMGNVGLIDMKPIFVNYDIANANGYFQADHVHLTDAGYLKYGTYVGNLLAAA